MLHIDFQVVNGQELKLQLIKDQMQEALESDKDAMSSALIVDGEMMSFEIEELKIRLREREIEVSMYESMAILLSPHFFCQALIIRLAT